MSGPETPRIHLGDDTRRIVHEALIDAPLAVVWRAVTSRALIAEWLGANDLEPEAGRSFTLELPGPAGEVSIADGEVLEVEPGRRLRFSLTERDDKDGEPAEIRSTVRIDLIETEAGVLFRLTHDGFERVTVGVPAYAMVWAVAQQRVLHIPRRPRTHRSSAPVAVRCELRRLAWAA